MSEMKGGQPPATKNALEPKPENIPEALKCLKHWIMWRLEPDDKGKLTKPPYHPRGYKCSTTDPNQWSTFDTAWAAYKAGGFDGIGFCFEGSGFVGIDVDHCVTGGLLAAEALEIVERFDTFVELSPSGTGLHLIVRGNLSGGGRKNNDAEIYASGRYFTCTGHRLVKPGDKVLPGEPQERQDAIDWFLEKFFSLDKPCPSGRATCSTSISSITAKEPDPEMIEAMIEADGGPGSKLALTFAGKREDLNDTTASGHDQALVSLLARRKITDPDVLAGWIVSKRKACGEDIEKLYKHPTYLRDTISKALAGIAPEDKECKKLSEDEAREILSSLPGSDVEDKRDAIRRVLDNTSVIGNLAVVADKFPSLWKAALEGLRSAGAPSTAVSSLTTSVNDAKKRLKVRHIRTPQPGERSCDGRSQVITNNRQHYAIVAEIERELARMNAENPSIFLRNGDLVRVVVDEKNRPAFKSVTEDWLRRRCSEIADFIRTQEDGSRSVSPPIEIVKSILAAGDTCGAFPVISLTESPILRGDGSVLVEPGYDKMERIYYHPAPGFSIPDIPDTPTQEEAKATAKYLKEELLCDFPFVDEASKSNLLGALVTVAVRHLISGPTPLFCISAPTAGSGKGLLSQVVSIITTGQGAGSDHDNGKREDEWRKALFSKLFTGRNVILIDNISTRLTSDVLSSTITSGKLDNRILGGNTKTMEVENHAVFFANGNNLIVGGDLPRRCVWTRIDPKMSEPYLRTDFRHKELETWVRSNRGALLAAILTMARGWIMAGRPAASNQVPRIGSFERWANMIGGILEFSGVHGFLGNYRSMIEENDTERDEWEVFLSAWKTMYGDKPMVLSDVAKGLTDSGGNLLRGFLPSQFDEPEYSQIGAFTRRLAWALRKIEGRRFGERELRIVKGVDPHAKVATWKVLERKA